MANTNNYSHHAISTVVYPFLVYNESTQVEVKIKLSVITCNSVIFVLESGFTMKYLHSTVRVCRKFILINYILVKKKVVLLIFKVCYQMFSILRKSIHKNPLQEL